jgi:hypothetical protein
LPDRPPSKSGQGAEGSNPKKPIAFESREFLFEGRIFQELSGKSQKQERKKDAERLCSFNVSGGCMAELRRLESEEA